MQHVSYVLASPDVVGEKFQEGMFILSLKSGKYFDVGNRYVALLKAFESGISVQALKQAAEQIETGAGNQITDAVNKLDFFDLLREVPASIFEVNREVCEEIFAAGPTFHIDSHDDLLELIGADPVHDVDSATGKITYTTVN